MPAYGSYAQAQPKLIAGARCLDFLNTVEENRTERLTSFSEFAIWAKAADLVDAAGQRRLLALTAKQPHIATKALAAVLEARDALTDLFADSRPQQTALAAVNGILERHRFVLRIESRKAGAHEHWEPDCPELLQPLLILLREAAELLSSPAQAHIHYCANHDCRWFFLDTSRNQSRRWCQMETCGNQAKARAHYRRQRAAS